eukprot:g18590.t1
MRYPWRYDLCKWCQLLLCGLVVGLVIYNEIAYFAPYGANHVGIFDLKSERILVKSYPQSTLTSSRRRVACASSTL